MPVVSIAPLLCVHRLPKIAGREPQFLILAEERQASVRVRVTGGLLSAVALNYKSL